MFSRFHEMVRKHGLFAGYMMIKCEANKLTADDVKTAGILQYATDSTLVKAIAGNLEEVPDYQFLAREGLRAVAYDLDLDTETYLKELGLLEEV